MTFRTRNQAVLKLIVDHLYKTIYLLVLVVHAFNDFIIARKNAEIDKGGYSLAFAQNKILVAVMCFGLFNPRGGGFLALFNLSVSQKVTYVFIGVANIELRKRVQKSVYIFVNGTFVNV